MQRRFVPSAGGHMATSESGRVVTMTKVRNTIDYHLAWLSKLFADKGYFAKDWGEPTKAARDARRPPHYALWTSAEGILAFLETGSIEEPVLSRSLQHISEHLFPEQDGRVCASAWPDYEKDADQGSVDSTTRVVLALCEARKHCLRLGLKECGGLDIPKMSDLIAKQLDWLAWVQNEDGGWGIQEGMLSMTDPTSFAVQALKENQQWTPVAGVEASVENAVGWFRKTQNADDGSWADGDDRTPATKKKKAACTAYALMALAETCQISDPVITRGTRFLVSNDDWDDYVWESPSAIGKPDRDFKPTKYRALAALLRSGESPSSDKVQGLLALILADRMGVNGDKDYHDYRNWLFYRYVAVNALQTYIDCEEHTGQITSHVRNSNTLKHMFAKRVCATCVPPAERSTGADVAAQDRIRTQQNVQAKEAVRGERTKLKVASWAAALEGLVLILVFIFVPGLDKVAPLFWMVASAVVGTLLALGWTWVRRPR